MFAAVCKVMWIVGAGCLAGIVVSFVVWAEWRIIAKGELKLSIELLSKRAKRSGEGVMRGNGRPKGCFWRVRFRLCALKVCS